jgi:hypothetical protein
VGRIRTNEYQLRKPTSRFTIIALKITKLSVFEATQEGAGPTRTALDMLGEHLIGIIY